MEILEILKKEYPVVEVVMISGHGNIEIAVKSTKMGAINFIEKPLTIEKTLESIENAIEVKKIKQKKSHGNLISKDSVKIIGVSDAIKNIKEQIENASKSNARVLILGSNGTGKESIAKLIHVNSDRSNKSFVAVNCAAIPENLIESELFGYEKGAFTGATGMKKGKFEIADGGTLFLDEVADMSLNTQAKVLRVLQEMEFERVGGNKRIKVDVRIIAATNKDILEEIKEGNFRDDLYYRLNVIPIKVPPLKDRREDIPVLIDYYLDYFAKQTETNEKEITDDAMEILKNAEWPGNVRELINIVERLNVMVTGNKITADDVRKYTIEKNFEDMSEEEKQDVISFIDSDNKSLKEAKGEFEKLYIIEKLKENNMNISQTARSLKMERSYLHRKIKQYDIKVDRDSEQD
jgi:two-component system nitrogen regulation response regulator NtrX